MQIILGPGGKRGDLGGHALVGDITQLLPQGMRIDTGHLMP